VDLTLTFSPAAEERLNTVVIRHNEQNGTSFTLQAFITRTLLELATLSDLSERQPAIDAEVEEFRSHRYKEASDDLIQSISQGP